MPRTCHSRRCYLLAVCGGPFPTLGIEPSILELGQLLDELNARRMVWLRLALTLEAVGCDQRLASASPGLDPAYPAYRALRAMRPLLEVVPRSR